MAFLEASGLGRDFPGVTALNDVDLKLELGRTHILAGENGAGKSTLVKILTGTDRQSRGQVFIDSCDPREDPSLYDQVSYVPQELNLFQEMSVAENLFMPFHKTGHGGTLVNSAALVKEARTYLDRFGIEADPRALVKNISVSDQQLLQIARACTNKKMSVLILDEPTSSLTQVEVDRVFKVIRDLLQQNLAIVFISHKMEEVLNIGDDYTVLRNGEWVESGLIEDIEEADLIRAMSGQDLAFQELFLPKAPTRDTIMAVRGLSGRRFSNINFDLYRGEILGFAGLVGAGRSEVMQTVFGFLKATGGQIAVDGKSWSLGKPSSSVKGGMLYLSEERKHHGIFPLLSLRENIGLSLFSLTCGPAGINSGAERDAVQKVIDDYDIKAPSMAKRISQLSGGNQQKAIIGRAMATRPKVIIFDEPTKGIDIRTKSEIYRIMRNLAEDGVGVILVSSELNELKKCANRIIAMHSGEITGEYDSTDTNNETLVGAIFGTGGETR
ncbi:ribose transport system ATP-binding protein [Cohaesibacter sp. ES.047]|uniref:sugar ABC transporter ATP-binding protein n=1 Tax=Cohaesibacter sp. ES.047 TaxID=1798205 RepID=UPI000BB6CC7F|nr:sugar ABC transporter ATP-binding protein [Cohaesibacter sp. ES.047]SNY91651.1 ribose transport system ATP-binding protein [Cohaesibacter sp. ES.047]